MEYTVFDALLDGVFVVDAANAIVYCNEPAAKLCESTVVSLQGQTFDQALPMEDFNIVEHAAPYFLKGEVTPYFLTSYGVGGRSGQIKICVQPIVREGENPKVLVFCRELSNEAESSVKNQELDAEVNPVSDKFASLLSTETAQAPATVLSEDLIKSEMGEKAMFSGLLSVQLPEGKGAMKGEAKFLSRSGLEGVVVGAGIFKGQEVVLEVFDSPKLRGFVVKCTVVSSNRGPSFDEDRKIFVELKFKKLSALIERAVDAYVSANPLAI